jgi:dTDP-4-amino-4,6-dideoxygalactose transaminase
VAGLNSRLDEIQAALLRVSLSHLPETTTRRREIAATYRAGLSSKKVRALAPPETATSHVFHLFVVRTAERSALQAHLNTHGVQSLVHYPVAAHRQPPAAGLRRDPRGLGAAEAFTDECLSLPCHPYLTAEEIGRVLSAVNSF